jgi:hypothetical protein
MSEFSQQSTHEASENISFEVPVWWSVSVGYESYEVRAHSAAEAESLVEQTVESDDGARIFISLSSENRQDEMKTRYPEDVRNIIRTIPFSAIEFPDSFETMTEEQEAALEFVFGE